LTGCDSSSEIPGLQGEAIDLTMDIARTDSTRQREDGVQEVTKHCQSLGLLDANGCQMNTNVPDDAISFTPDDITIRYFS